jgi:LysM repeat protein
MDQFEYVVQPGDSLYSIANKFSLPVNHLIRNNQLNNPYLIVGQRLKIPMETRQLQYKPVTAYTADRPIYVNGMDINTGAYPVLNYQPPNTAYPYIYVPIAEFRRVGAKVLWDEAKQIIVVESDYDQLKNEVTTLRAENQRLKDLLASYQPVTQAGNTSGNITNWGIAAKQGDWVYFSNITNNNKLYKMRITGESKEKLSDDNSLYINVVGEWIYYINRSDQGKIYKIRIDGTQKTRIDPNLSASVMVVVGDWIYFVTPSEQYRMYKMRTDGTEKTRIGDDATISNLYVQDEWVYYTFPIGTEDIYKMKVDGTQKTRLTSEGASQMNIVGPYIYYVRIKGGGIFRINQDGTGKLQYNTQFANPTYMNVTNDWIYYGYSDLYKRKLDTPEDIKITPIYGFAGLINIVDDWIYLRIQYNGEKLLRMKTDKTQQEIIGA